MRRAGQEAGRKRRRRPPAKEPPDWREPRPPDIREPGREKPVSDPPPPGRPPRPIKEPPRKPGRRQNGQNTGISATAAIQKSRFSGRPTFRKSVYS